MAKSRELKESPEYRFGTAFTFGFFLFLTNSLFILAREDNKIHSLDVPGFGIALGFMAGSYADYLVERPARVVSSPKKKQEDTQENPGESKKQTTHTLVKTAMKEKPTQEVKAVFVPDRERKAEFSKKLLDSLKGKIRTLASEAHAIIVQLNEKKKNIETYSKERERILNKVVGLNATYSKLVAILSKQKPGGDEIDHINTQFPEYRRELENQKKAMETLLSSLRDAVSGHNLVGNKYPRVIHVTPVQLASITRSP